jgi:5-methylthioadenosine/S-adenosylhomocysteine deaminase
VTLFAGASWLVRSAELCERDSSLRVSDGRIREVGHGLTPRPDEEVVDCRGMLLIPGLINGHTHAAENALRGLGKSLSTERWMSDFVYPINRSLTDEDVYWSTVLGCADSFRNGTTAVVDLVPNYVRFHADSAVRAYRDVGMRAAVARGAATRSLIDAGEQRSADEELREADAYLRRWSGDRLVQAWIGPSGYHAADPETLTRLKALSRERGTRFNIHLSETTWQRDLARRNGHEGQVDWALASGLLGPDTLVAHAVWVSDAEIVRLAETRSHVVHNATSNQLLASGIAPVRAMRRAGVNVALGCDGAGSNDSADMVAEMKAAVLLQRLAALDPEALSARDALRMATEGGAAAMGIGGDVGRLDLGWAADLVGIQLAGNPSLQPSYDPIDLLVYSGSGRDVALTVVDGRVTYLRGTFPTLDLPRALAAMAGLQERVERTAAGTAS